jgi:PTS system fructose-specific IIC component
MNVLIVTQCPSGLTTSYIAANALSNAAAELNWDVTAEIHSSVQPVQIFTAEQIQAADMVIIAADGSVDINRFVGKRVYRGSIATSLQKPQEWLKEAQQNAVEQSPQGDTAAPKMTTTQYSAKAQPSPPSLSVQSSPATRKNIIAITACPTGVAHTFMAAEALQEAAGKLGHLIKVETRGSVGASNQLTDADIAQADLLILAVDIEVDSSQFAGKPVYRTSTGNALKKPVDVINTAIASASVESAANVAAGVANAAAKKDKAGAYKHLMTGVSFMLPVVVAGGLIIAISFIFGIEAFKEEGSLAAALMQIGGGSAFALMIPVLAGYIAFSIADRPGLAPGLIGGMLASSTGAGFLGGIVAGFLAGYSARFLVEQIKLPKTVEALKPILIVPLLASLVTGLIMIYVVGTPVAAVMTALTDFLQSMGSTNAILLGIILGCMMCFDLGGPVNKAAYTFGVGLLASQTYAPMAAIMAAGMVPPIGMGLATFLGRRQFSETEHEAGRASFILGLCFISEGAIPFAARDPLRVIPACMAGGALTGALSMLVGAKLMAPHGGIFVLFIPNAITPVFLYVGAIAAGSVVTALMYLLLKSRSFSTVPSTT